ncbi:hypothetical protein [Streptomyces sp. YGL11-2]|uniref:hypothetical protein n=1 Tax=Streptomyces sp. YGL11-2 TaxID=3414028 RepID=UPI003CF9E054
MSHEWTRRVASVTASAALLSAAAAAAGSAAFAAPAHPHGAPAAHRHTVGGDQGKHKGEEVKGDHGRHLHLGWDKGVDKKHDRWDAQHKVWQRWDTDSRSYAQWDEHAHCWKRHKGGHWQRWDLKHRTWK